MANTLRVKRNAWNATSSSANKPVADSLTYGELAWNNIDNTLYIGKQMNATPLINSYRVIPDATATIIGAASFSTNNFVVNSGAVQIKDLGIATEEIAADAVTSSKIADDAVTSDHIGDNQVLAAAIVDDITLAGNCGTTGNFTVGANLTVTGTQTIVNSTVVEIADLAIELAKNATASASADGGGIILGGYSGCPSILYDDTGTQWELNKNTDVTGTFAVSGLTTLSGGIQNTTLDFGTYVNP
jgi:hypothetical protein